MKTRLITTLFMGFITITSASAAQQINHTNGEVKMGVVSAGNAYTLEELSEELSRKADDKGAGSYKILSVTGNNRLHGVAVIYK